MAKHGELASKIWRTIVFSGAMLGAPLASADAPKPTAKVDASAELDTKIAAAIDAVVKATTEADRKAAVAKLEALRKDKAAAAKPSALEKLGSDLAAIKIKIQESVDAAGKAQTDADRKAAIAKVDAYNKEKAELERKLASEKTKASPVDLIALDLSELDARVQAAVNAVATAKTDADRKAATAKLEGLRKERVALDAKLKTAKTDKRPRAKEDERPVGRGFILA